MFWTILPPLHGSVPVLILIKRAITRPQNPAGLHAVGKAGPSPLIYSHENARFGDEVATERKRTLLVPPRTLRTFPYYDHSTSAAHLTASLRSRHTCGISIRSGYTHMNADT